MAWFRARPYAFDSLIAAVVALTIVTSLVEEIADPSKGYREVDGPAIFLALGTAGVLIWRRKAPVRSFVALLALALVLFGVGYPELGTSLPALVASYSIAAYGGRAATRRWGVGVGGAALVTILLIIYARHPDDVTLIPSVAGTFIPFGAVMLLGANRGHRRALEAEKRQRLEQEEAHRKTEGERALAEERNRIARELHDIVAHSMSVMVVQATAARRVIDKDPAAAATALEAIESTGRSSMTEMRRLLGVLRSDRTDDGSTPDSAPQPGLHSIAALAEQFRATGVDVDVVVDPALSLSPAIGLCVYRVVQESLTNVLKHAGPARVTVRIGTDGDVAAVDVTDDGRGVSAMNGANGTGHGLMGMRERVQAFGGTLRTGGVPGGGFRVHAVIPLAAASDVVVP